MEIRNSNYKILIVEMNKLYSVIAFIITMAFLGASAQRKHLPILEPGKEWRYKSIPNWRDDNPSYYTVKVLGDTIINDTIATKLGRFYDEDIIAGDSRPASLFFAYEEDGRYYEYDGRYKHFIQLLDFNYTTGEIIYPQYDIGIDYSITYDIVKDDVVDMYGIERRLLTFDVYTAYSPAYWIEGIGTYYKYDVMFHGSEVLDYHNYKDYRIIACYKDGELIFSEGCLEYSGVKEVGADVPAAKPETQKIYDLYGRRVANPQRGSIYIVDGKKIVWQ